MAMAAGLEPDSQAGAAIVHRGGGEWLGFLSSNNGRTRLENAAVSWGLAADEEGRRFGGERGVLLSTFQRSERSHACGDYFDAGPKGGCLYHTITNGASGN